MKSRIESIKLSLTIEEVEMLATELHYIIHNNELDGKTDLKVTMMKKLKSHFDVALKQNNLSDSLTGYKKIPNE